MEVNRTGLSDLTEDKINNLAADLIQCILSNQLPEARALVETLSYDVRKELTRKHAEVEVNPVLFTAVKMGSTEFIEFLVTECHADLEEHGIYHVEEDRSEHIVTPLWCAAVANKLEAVEVLVRLGADVNAVSDTGSTPVRSSCYMTNIEVVKFLADHGGDLEKPNRNGGTCLINSVQNAELCRFLIDRGVDVNVADTSGNLALHYAIKEGRFETVQLLVERGSNPYMRNEYGDDALQCASLKGYVDIVEFLLKTLQPSIERQIEAYQLMGGNFIDEKLDTFHGLAMWKKAIKLRSGNCNNDVVGAKRLPLNPAYGFATEATSLPELDAVGRNQDLTFMQALLLRENILGPNHKETIFGLMYRGAVYADSHEFNRCIALWKYAFKLRHAVGEHLSHEYIFTLQALCKLFWEIHDNDFNVAAQKGLHFSEVFEVLDVVAQECEEIRNLVKTGALSDFEKDKLLCLMQLILHLIHLLYKLSKDDSQSFMLKKLVHRLIRLGLRSSNGKTLLLLAVIKSTTFVTDEYYSPLPSVPIIEILLECGADVQDMDESRNTALHLLEEDVNNTDVIRNVANLLVAAGAHTDYRNNNGQQAAHHLAYEWLKIDFSVHTTLKCLAARVIQREKISYIGIIPQPLYTFVEMH